MRYGLRSISYLMLMVGVEVYLESMSQSCPY